MNKNYSKFLFGQIMIFIVQNSGFNLSVIRSIQHASYIGYGPTGGALKNSNPNTYSALSDLKERKKKMKNKIDQKV